MGSLLSSEYLREGGKIGLVCSRLFTKSFSSEEWRPADSTSSRLLRLYSFLLGNSQIEQSPLPLERSCSCEKSECLDLVRKEAPALVSSVMPDLRLVI